VYGASYNVNSRSVTGQSRIMSQAVASDQGVVVAELTDDGSLVYRSGQAKSSLTLVRPGGAVELLFSGLDAPAEPRLSPDGTRIVLASNNSTQLLNTAGDQPPLHTNYSLRPAWTTDSPVISGHTRFWTSRTSFVSRTSPNSSSCRPAGRSWSRCP